MRQNYRLLVAVMLQLCPLDVAERALMLQLCASDVAHNKTTLSERLEKGRFIRKNVRNTEGGRFVRKDVNCLLDAPSVFLAKNQVFKNEIFLTTFVL